MWDKHYTVVTDVISRLFCDLPVVWVGGWVDGWMDGWVDGWMPILKSKFLTLYWYITTRW